MKRGEFYIVSPVQLSPALRQEIVADEIAAAVREGATVIREVAPPKPKWKIVSGP